MVGRWRRNRRRWCDKFRLQINVRFVVRGWRVAYLTTLASVTLDDVERLRINSAHLLLPSRYEFVSHFVAYSVQAQPLGALLGQMIDGGEPINPDLWHPLRAPVVHFPEDVRDLHSQLEIEWNPLLAQQDFLDDDWYRIEIGKLMAVFEHAVQSHECVVNIIHPPIDEERALRVRMPIVPQTGRPT